jgi:mRNA interferase MazF
MDKQEKPPRIQPSLRSAPKIRQLYWCDFPVDAQLPEFWKRRPVVIVSFRHTLYGTVTAVPCSSSPQPENRFAFPMRTTIDGKAAWAICDKPSTFAVSRLIQHYGSVPRMPEDEFRELLGVLLSWLPSLES